MCFRSRIDSTVVEVHAKKRGKSGLFWNEITVNRWEVQSCGGAEAWRHFCSSLPSTTVVQIRVCFSMCKVPPSSQNRTIPKRWEHESLRAKQITVITYVIWVFVRAEGVEAEKGWERDTTLILNKAATSFCMLSPRIPRWHVETLQIMVQELKCFICTKLALYRAHVYITYKLWISEVVDFQQGS